MGRVSLRDIANATGYSPATVSNVLNNKGNVGADTTRIILEATDRMGYRRPGRLDHVTLAIPRSGKRILNGGPAHLDILAALEDAARRSALRLAVCSLDMDDHDELDRQSRELRHDGTGAVVLIATGLGSMTNACLDCFEGCEVPLVVVGGRSDRLDFDVIDVANESATYRACTYLARLGHTRIGYVAGDPTMPKNPPCEQGFRRAMADARLVFDEKDRVSAPGELEAATEAARQWISQGRSLPTAFVSDSDVAAAAMLRAAQGSGLSVPDDVSIVGFGDEPICRHVSPQLTTMYAPCNEVGDMAIRSILQQVSDKHHCSSFIQIHARLVERDSVRSLL